MIDMKETIEGAEAILNKLWARRDEVTLEQVRDAYAEAYGYLKQGVVMCLEDPSRLENDTLVAALDRANGMIGQAADEAAALDEKLRRAEKERDQLGAMCAAYEEKFKLQREVVCAARDWRKSDDMTPGARAALADAVDALNKWEKERAKEAEQA